VVTAVRHGEAAVRVHFQQFVEAVVLTVPYQQAIPSAASARRNNAIDDRVFEKLAELNLPPSELCDDATFLRRVTLDLIGTLPTPSEVREFLADARSDKRARRIDELLARPEFVDYWTLVWSDQFQNRKERDHDVRGTKGVRSFSAWLRAQVAANRPWNQLVADVLTATGDSVSHPEIGFFIVTVGENRNAERSEVVDSVAQAFLGTRIGCARCHNHPLERYTQDDYYHFAGFFSRVHLKRQESQKGPTTLLVATEEEQQVQRELTQAEQQLAEARQQAQGKSADELQAAERRVAELDRKRIDLARRHSELHRRPAGATQPRTGKFLTPRPLDRMELAIEPGSDPRQALAAWMIRPDNEYFSGSLVNRLWKHFFGNGLVEPVDDLRASNPPSNPELWKLLIREFVDHGYDVRHLMRLIVNSRTYQLDSATLPANQYDTRLHSHFIVRRLPAEVLLDALSQTTGVPEPFPGYPVGMRAIQLPDPGINSYFLGLFGRSERVTACACERNGEVTLPQLLHLQNGDLIARKVLSAECRLTGLLQTEPDDSRLVDELCLWSLGRTATAEEQAVIFPVLKQGTDRKIAFQDLLWALINTKAYVMNH
jgi:hypothetical protein